jgi:RNA polymerase sigma-70 factor (ECF subfamily)
VTAADQLAQQFETHRRHLQGVAYSILGTISEAEDVVQDAWLRLQRVDADDIDDLRAWLTTVVGRLALDVLGSARKRREAYVGPWLPEPLVALPSQLTAAAAADSADPAERVTLDESVSLAVMVVLETLTPAERTAFLLHDVFGVDFPEVARVVGRTPAACRQLATRARRHVAERAPRFDADADEARRVVEAFLAAAMGGDLQQLASVLDPEVVWRADGGGQVRASRRAVVGDDNVGRLVLGLAERGGAGVTHVSVVPVNGRPGIVMQLADDSSLVMGFAVAGGRVTEIDVVVNPDKLRHLPRLG